METTILSPSLMEKIKLHLKEKGNPTYYFDYRDTISVDTIYKAVQEQPEFPLDLIGQDWDFYEDEIVYLKEELEDNFSDEIEGELGEYVDYKELARDLREDFLELICMTYDVKGICRDVPVRIPLYSNYDCINSHYFESQSPYEVNSYFGDVVKVMKLNPAEIKNHFSEKGIVFGKGWRNKKTNPYVKVEDLWIEEENRSCPACLFVMVGMMDGYTMLTTNWKEEVKLKIPKGNYCGFYSNWQGGGSVIEAPLLRDMEITINKPMDKSEYLKFGLDIDVRGGNGYSIDEVYGVTEKFYGDKIQVL